MKTFLLFLTLLHGTALAQRPQPAPLKEAVADFPRSQLQLKTKGPVSLDVDRDRAGYERLAEIAGLNVVFDPDFRDSASGPFRIQDMDVLEAFDVLSARTGSFIEVLNANTIVVAPDNQTKRRDHDFMVLKTFYLPSGASSQRLTEIVTTLRATLQARYIATSSVANAIVMRDNPARIAAAQKIIESAMPLVAGPAVATMGESIAGSGHILILENGVVRDSAPARDLLKFRGSGSASFELKESTRFLFERLAGSAGLNVIFDADFRSLDGQAFKVDNLDLLDAMDVLALQTRSFWQPVDSQTIMVAPDNQTKRRDFENLALKTFYLPNVSQVEMVEIVTALRTLLNARYLATVTESTAIVMRDNANKLALAERIVSDLRKSSGGVTTTGFPSGSEGRFILNRRAAQALGVAPLSVQSRVPGPFSFDSNDTARATYEAVAAAAGLRIVFDSRFQDIGTAAFKVQNVDIVDALDFLALQTRTIWQMMDRETVLVAPDNPAARTGLPAVTKTITLSQTGSQRYVSEMVTALRSILNIRQISAIGNSIVMTDTDENAAFSERMVRDLERR